MKNKNIKTLADKIVNWAKESGRIYSQEIEFKRVCDGDDERFVHVYPDVMSKFINKTRDEITNLDNSDLRELEDCLLHIPEEKSFIQSQIIAINLIRSIVFLEIDTRRNRPPMEPGE